MTTPEERLKIALSILDFEARRDRQGRLQVFNLPSGDGGGSFEVAGINERHHPEEARHLAQLIEAGRHEEAEQQATEIIATFTDAVSTWAKATAVESYLRDTAFNRGPRGAARIMQRALGVVDDGVVGPKTRAAIAEQAPAALLKLMRRAREQYERDVAGRNESSKFWKGLVNRWNKALDFAEDFLPLGVAEAPSLSMPAMSLSAAAASPSMAAAQPFGAAEAVIANAMAATNAMAASNVTAASSIMAANGSGPVPLAPSVGATPFIADAPALSPDSVPVTIRALRIGSEGALVRAWQSFLLGQNLDPGGNDGEFGDKTVAATQAFQRRHGLSPDGIAGRQTIIKAMELGFELIEEPAPDISGSNFPPRPDFPPLVSTPARQAVFGRFDFVADPKPGNKENIRILGDWDDNNVVSVAIPQLKMALGSSAPSGMRFHRRAAEQLKGLWSDWERNNLLDRVLTYDGAFVPRFIRGSTRTLSNHAFASAFDINASTNGLGVRPPLVGRRGCVRELVPLAHKWGFFWGGHFGGRPDGMHFEIAVLK